MPNLDDFLFSRLVHPDVADAIINEKGITDPIVVNELDDTSLLAALLGDDHADGYEPIDKDDDEEEGGGSNPEVPGIPQNVTGTRNGTNISVSWSPVTGTDMYEVLVNGESNQTTANGYSFEGILGGTYMIQVRAGVRDPEHTSSYIWGEYSGNITIQIPSTVPPPPETVGVQEVTATSIDVHYSGWKDFSGEYEVRVYYNTAGGVIGPHMDLPGREGTVTIDNLTPDTDYEIRVLFLYEGEEGPYTSITAGTIPEEIPVPDNVVSSVSGNTISLEYTPWSGKEPVTYNVRTRYRKSDANDWNYRENDGTTNPVILTDLDYSTEYEIQMCYVYRNVAGEYTNSLLIQTQVQPEEPDDPEDDGKYDLYVYSGGNCTVGIDGPSDNKSASELNVEKDWKRSFYCTPHNGYSFVGWYAGTDQSHTDTLLSSENPWMVTVTEDMSIVAVVE